MAGEPVDRLPVTVFKDRRWLLVLYLVLGAILLVQGIATAAYFILIERQQGGVTVIAVGLSVFVAWLGYWFASYAWRRQRDQQDPIVVGPAGLHDRALSERPIAWSDIRNLRVREDGRSGRLVVFDLADGAGARAGILKRAQRATFANRPFGYTHHIHGMGTDASLDRLIAAIAPYMDVTR